ncbi:hypothetical protein LTR78_002327 [Recurvomyces mirabilis]|uniref:Uncharacterized protein n=1 Tax=Recurvomyces mirabilis TaxID=574656 RepID=A0AAE0WT94_9PEZI|nr:hypothetical protein LTR78_002327 [Recurvomyces mirabilis]KAK5157255.1 hypothetical protein LTS14_004020 [Recurvomyces mirabilis]
MVPRTAYPPTQLHLTKTTHLNPSQAQETLSSFLANLEQHAYLHPDAQLSSSGIAFAAQSGSKGGIAVHHLRRIEAGLRGENLAVESFEDLALQFGGTGADELPEGDDGTLDRLIDGGKANKTASIVYWAETTSEAAYGSTQHQQRPLDDDPDAQDQISYEISQQPMKGEVGERDAAAPVSQAGGAPPPIQHVRDKGKGKGKANEGKGQRPLDPKLARKEAKKARRKAEKSANDQAKG